MTETTSRGIPTIFEGIEYRSRLEARWAAFFTAIGWQYTYEPFDGAGYIPDFVIHGQAPLAVEIKPAANESQLRAPIAKVVSGLDGLWTDDILILGISPLLSLDHETRRSAPGLLGQFFEPISEWDFAFARWMLCRKCEQISVWHDVQSFHGRPCGCHEGTHYLGPIDRTDLQILWAHAANEVKWRGRGRF